MNFAKYLVAFSRSYMSGPLPRIAEKERKNVLFNIFENQSSFRSKMLIIVIQYVLQLW